MYPKYLPVRWNYQESKVKYWGKIQNVLIYGERERKKIRHNKF